MAATTTTSMLTFFFFCSAAFLAADGRHVVDSGRIHDHEEKPEPEASGGGGGGDLIAQACVNASMHFSRHNSLSQEFCESALRSDKRSSTAKHPRDLALIAVDHLQRGAAVAAAKVDSALQKLKDENRTSDYSWFSWEMTLHCQVSYVVVDRVAPVCRDMVQEFDAAQEGSGMDELLAAPYLDCVNRMTDATGDCRGNAITFSNEEAKDQVEAVEEAYRRAILAKAMMEQMIQFLDFDE